MHLKRLITVSLIALVLSACTRSSGVLVTEEQAAQFQRGKSTYNEVVEKLGKPSSTMTFANGMKAASYSYLETNTRPETAIPVVGIFAGGTDVKSNTITFMFGQDGVLTDYTAVTGQNTSINRTTTQSTKPASP